MQVGPSVGITRRECLTRRQFFQPRNRLTHRVDRLLRAGARFNRLPKVSILNFWIRQRSRASDSLARTDLLLMQGIQPQVGSLRSLQGLP